MGSDSIELFSLKLKRRRCDVFESIQCTVDNDAKQGATASAAINPAGK
jgi:hypothetical protein